MRNASDFFIGWWKDRSISWKLSVVCFITLLIPMIIMCFIYISQANNALYQNQQESSQEYLRSLSENIGEKALRIEEYSLYLYNMPSLYEYLRRDFHMDAQSVLNLRNTVYPSVELIQSVHKDVINSVTIYSNNPTHQELGRIFQSCEYIEEPEVLDFIASDKTTEWIFGQKDPASRFMSPLENPEREVNMFLRKCYLVSGEQIGVIVVTSRDDQLFAALMSPDILGEYTLLDTSSNIRDQDMLMQEITRLGLSISMTSKISKLDSINTMSNIVIVIAMLTGLLLMSFFVRAAINRLFGRFRLTLETVEQVSQGRFHVRINDDHDDEIGLMSHQFNNLLDQLEKTVEQLMKEEQQRRDSQMEALQYQLNPHFIYNSMYMLQLTLENNNLWKLSDAVCWLADILQYNVNGTSFATFTQEIDHLTTYLRFVNVFRETPIELTVDCPAGLLDYTFLRFVFQPLVENAIKYGGREVSAISIKIRQSTSICYIEVSNNGEAVPDDVACRVNALLLDPNEYENGTRRIGLRNIASRIRLFYKSDAGICLVHGENTLVRIHFPYEKPER